MIYFGISSLEELDPPSAVPCTVNSSTYDIPLILITLTYAYEYLEDGKKKSKLILLSLFACSAVYFHSVNFILSFLGLNSIIYVELFLKKYYKPNFAYGLL